VPDRVCALANNSGRAPSCAGGHPATHRERVDPERERIADPWLSEPADANLPPDAADSGDALGDSCQQPVSMKLETAADRVRAPVAQETSDTAYTSAKRPKLLEAGVGIEPA
jgi:hypothetical protein